MFDMWNVSAGQALSLLRMTAQWSVCFQHKKDVFAIGDCWRRICYAFYFDENIIIIFSCTVDSLFVYVHNARYICSSIFW